MLPESDREDQHWVAGVENLCLFRGRTEVRLEGRGHERDGLAADSHSKEVKRNQPFLLLVHSISAAPGPEGATSSSAYWLPVFGYRTDEGCKAVMTDAG
jgi:hypothetical protein